MSLRTGKWGRYYQCRRYPECLGRQGAKADGSPSGFQGNAETREARAEAARALAAVQRAWRDPERVETALQTIESQSGIKRPFQVARRDLDTCRRIIEAVRGVLETAPPKNAYQWLRSGSVR